MKLVAALIVVLSAVAHAQPALDEYGDGEPLRPARELQLGSCSVAVELRGAVAAIELRQVIANSGPRALAARYQLGLPRGAAVVGATLAQAGAPQPALAVPAAFATVVVEDPAVLGPDPLVVEAVPASAARPGESGEQRYRATLQPIAPGHEVALTVRYTMVAELHGGGLTLVLPGHGAGPQCRGTLHAVAGPGTRISGVRLAGTELRSPATFTLGAAPAVLDVALDVTGAQPVMWTQTDDLGAGWSATLVTVLAPARPRAVASHAMFVVDGSRSMELVGRARVTRVLHAIATALPSTTLIDAIVYDRSAARVLGGFRTASPDAIAALEAGVRAHPAGNGSDLTAAFALAHTALADARGPVVVIAITDGVLGDDPGAALTQALDGKTTTLDVHTIVLDPAATRSPGMTALRAPINHYGGTLVELAGDDVDRAVGDVADWLQPAARALALDGIELPDQLRAGAGFTRAVVHRSDRPVSTLTGHDDDDADFRVAAHPGPAASIAALALADATVARFAERAPVRTSPARPGAAGEPDNATDAERADAEHARAALVLARARARHPAVDADHALAVLASGGRVAASRRDMLRGGGPYMRTVAVADPPSAVELPAPPASPPASVLDRPVIARLFRDQLGPRASACYQRALGRTPRLTAAAFFELRLGRGEVTQATVSGVVDPAFQACLLDAVYALDPPVPDPALNADEQTVAHYSLGFTVRDDHPVILPGDADSSSALDIDAIPPGVPERRRPIRVDTSSPLGGMRPSP